MIIPFVSDSQIKAQQTIITDFDVINALNILQIHLFAEQNLHTSDQAKRFVQQLTAQTDTFNEIKKIFFDTMKLTHLNTPIFLAFRQILNLITKLDLLTKYQLADKKFNFDLNVRSQEVRKIQFIDSIIEMNETHKYFEEEFQDRRGELNFLIQDWLNLIYPFLNELGMEEEKTKAQVLAYSILQNPIHLKSIWDQVIKSQDRIIGKAIVDQRKEKLRYNTLDIFEGIMADPIEKIGDFTLLMMVMCGDKDHAYEHRVVELLKSYKGADIDPMNRLNPRLGEKSLLQIILLKFETFTVNIDTSALSDTDFLQYVNICILLGKIISHNALYYEELNEEFLYCLIDNESVADVLSKKSIRGRQNFQNYEQNEPKDFPQSFIDERARIYLEESIIGQSLTQIYQPLISNFFQLNFRDVNDFSDFTFKLFKLTNILLAKFKDVNPLQKNPISHALPQFDPLLQIIVNILNQVPIENIITSVLLVTETQINGLPTGLQNKFLIQQLSKGKMDSKHRNKIIKLIKSAFKCLNTLLELAHINAIIPTLTQGNIGPRAYWLSNLKSVQTITSFILNPSVGPSYQVARYLDSEMTFSIFNIIQYYVRPGATLAQHSSEIQQLAIEFFINCCKIWDVPSNRPKVSLESLLRVSGLSHNEVKGQYIKNFQEFSRAITQPASLSYLCSFLDLLIISATSQQPFLEDLLKEQEFKTVLIELIKIDFSKSNSTEMIQALQKNIQCKLVILLSEISMNRISNDFMKTVAESDNLKQIYDNIIVRLVPDLKKTLDIDYQFNFSEDVFQRNQKQQFNSRKSFELFNVCQSLITLKYYVRLLQDEYSRNLDNKHVRQAITMIFEDQQITDLQLMFSRVDDIYNDVQALNQVLLTDPSQRNEELAKLYHRESQNHLISNELRNFMENSKLATDGFFLFINNLDATLFYTYLQKVPAHQFLTTTSLDFSHYSKLGPQFAINTDEFLNEMRQYFYQDEIFLSQVKVLTSKYNMALSYLYSFNQFSEGFKNFILNIGKTRTRENLRNKEYILKDRVINTSLFVLAEKEDLSVILANDERVKGVQNTLSKIMINISRSMIQQILNKLNIAGGGGFGSQASMIEQYDFPRLYFEGKQLETDLDYLTIILGVINNLSTIAPLSQDNIKQLDIAQQLVKALPAIRQYQLSTMNIREGLKASRAEIELRSSKLFVSLVLQVFSICIIIQKAQQDQQRQREMLVIRDLQSDMEYIQIVSTVIKLMQENYCFIEGIQIMEQSLSLILNENMVMFMKRQDSPPLRMIIQKFLNPNTTVVECIKIIEFLISFAGIDQGAEQLNKENILHSISISSILSKVNSQDYYTLDGESKRNPIHILWCYVLVFIRTLNSKLINDFEYRKTISSQMRLFEIRVIKVLEIGSILKASTDPHLLKNSLSLALFEELDLITGCLQQLFDYVDQFDQQDFKIYADIKDRFLYSVIHLFSQDWKVKQGSSSEHYMNGIQHDKMKENMAGDLSKASSFTGFDLMVQIEKIRLFLNMNSSMLNMLLINQQQMNGVDLLNTWDKRDQGYNRQSATPRRVEFDNISHQSHSIYTAQTFYNPDMDYDEVKGMVYLTTAIHNYLTGLSSVNKQFKFWVGQEQSLGELFRDINGLIKHDEWINNEYLGLNHYLAGNSFKEIMEQFESSMQMGYLTCALLLQNLYQLQKDREGLIGSGRSSTSLKELMDFGESIKKQYAEFASDNKKSALVKPSVDTFGDIIKGLVDTIKQNPNQSIQDRYY